MKDLSYSQIWKEAPFIRLLIPLTAGILLQYFFPITKSLDGLILICCTLVLIFSLFIPLKSLFRIDRIAGLAIQMAFLSLGRWLIFCHQDIQITGSQENNIREGFTLIARLENDPVKKPRSFKSTATIHYLCTSQCCYREKEKIFIYFQTTQQPEKISPGSVIAFRKPLIPIENTGSFTGFDYKRYCRLKHIYAQVFLAANDYTVLGKEKQNVFRSCLISWRKKLLAILKHYIPGKEENSLLEALMIGYTDDLDHELVQSYSNTGVVHIIAISGLHLALIYQILQFLLGGINGRKSGKWIKCVILLGSLWFFSFLSGASPSVIRSAVMFSLLLLARNLSRESIVYNTLASSAFLLLCFDPFWLWDTGFQLSYSAVLSLVVFSKSISGLFSLKNKLLTGLWNSASVSVAAQILTTPISLYYFHRFPNYFLFCNLLAVPLSSIILIGGMLLCLFSFLPVMAGGIAWLLNKGIVFLNGFVEYVARLPGAVTDQLSVNILQVISLYVFILYISLFLKDRNKKWLVSALICICFFLLIRVLAFWK